MAQFLWTQPLEQLHISIVSIAELHFGIEQVSDTIRRSDLAIWLDSEIRTRFTDRTLALTEDVLVRWRLMIEFGRRKGQTYSHPDILIAATAAHHRLTVMTRNRNGFVAAGVPVYDPWTGQRIEPDGRSR